MTSCILYKCSLFRLCNFGLAPVQSYTSTNVPTDNDFTISLRWLLLSYPHPTAKPFLRVGGKSRRFYQGFSVYFSHFSLSSCSAPTPHPNPVTCCWTWRESFEEMREGSKVPLIRSDLALAYLRILPLFPKLCLPIFSICVTRGWSWTVPRRIS